eukprot:gb/GECG01007129.1/.p1 GENE.gb/GECG01007129.1/~~gb/GECG01007129.1/.p1  ORF type:complete len:109 (+),score=7.57 gb/GECG01007129.1/:1-327(+)
MSLLLSHFLHEAEVLDYASFLWDSLRGGHFHWRTDSPSRLAKLYSFSSSSTFEKKKWDRLSAAASQTAYFAGSAGLTPSRPFAYNHKKYHLKQSISRQNKRSSVLESG